jgi:hypothetical protein
MKKSHVWLILVVVVFVLFALWLVLFKERVSTPKILPPPPQASPEAKSSLLPKVITLYQKGEGESDLAAFVAREMAAEFKDKAKFRAINVLDEPQMSDYFGVTTVPAIVFLLPSGKLFKVFEGYLDKNKILSVLNSIE